MLFGFLVLAASISRFLALCHARQAADTRFRPLIYLLWKDVVSYLLAVTFDWHRHVCTAEVLKLGARALHF